MPDKDKTLNKGLDALLGNTNTKQKIVKEIQLDKIMPGSYPLYMLLHLLRQDASDSDQCVRACIACSTFTGGSASAPRATSQSATGQSPI